MKIFWLGNHSGYKTPLDYLIYQSKTTSNRYNSVYKLSLPYQCVSLYLIISFLLSNLICELLLSKRTFLYVMTLRYESPFDIRPPLEDIKWLARATYGGLICQIIRYCTVEEEWENCGCIDWLLWLEFDAERRRARESYDPLRVIANATLVRIGLQPLFAQHEVIKSLTNYAHFYIEPYAI
jgi:hypothetical protein